MAERPDSPPLSPIKVDWLVYIEDLKMLMKKVTSHRYYKSDTDSGAMTIMNMCMMLFDRDYECQYINNEDGRICPNYPGTIIIPVKEKLDFAEAQFPRTSFDTDEYTPLVEASRLARRRNRFPVPVILFEGKYICRSAATHANVASQWHEKDGRHRTFESRDFEYGMTIDSTIYLLKNVKFREQIRRDIDVMRHCNIHYIFDMRIENTRHKRSETVNVTEDFYEQHYAEFVKVFLPYPEVATFKEFSLNPDIELLYYNWSGRRRLISFQLPASDYVKPPANIDFTKYKDWSVILLTQNYLSILLEYVTSSKRGVLIHCITGIDRTPLFITLLRLSLWADGLIHKSLNPIEMTYFTLAYDWYLFGHDLPKREEKGYLIMLFCFTCVLYLSSDRFSIRASTSSSSSKRKDKLRAVSNLFLEQYYDMMEKKAQRKKSSKKSSEKSEESEASEKSEPSKS